MQAPVKLAFLGYYPMVVASRLYPPCVLTQSLESYTGERVEVIFHVDHVLEWLLLLNALPLLLVLGEVIEEPSLQFVPLLILAGGAVILIEPPEDVVEVFLTPGALEL